MECSGLTSNDSHIISFVAACYLYNAIDTAELQKWAEGIIDSCDNYPSYLLDLISYHEARANIYNIIGFVPATSWKAGEQKAIMGISHIRGFPQYGASSRASALKAIQQHPEILEKFHNVFPFIRIDKSGVLKLMD